jgi:hypothetical protein
MEARTLLATMVWTNAAGGDWDVTNNWVNAANSSDHHVPTSSDDAQINTTGITVTHSSSISDAAHSLTSQSAVQITGGSLALAASSTITDLSVGAGASLSLSSLTLSGTGTLTNAGTLTLSGDTINTALSNQGTLRVAAGAGSTINRSFSNAAGATLRVQADLNGGSATLTVAQGLTSAGTIDLTEVNGGNSFTATLTVTAGTLVKFRAIRVLPHF